MDASFDEQLVRIVEEYLSLIELGRVPDPEVFAEKLPTPLREPFLKIAIDYFQHPEEEQLTLDSHDSIGGYAVVRELGQGMSGVVYSAHSPDGELVAIKVLYDHLAFFPKALERFHQEAQLLQAIQHPNVVRVLDTGSEGNRHFLVLEYLDGGTLADRIHERNRTDKLPRTLDEIRKIARVAVRIADALGHLHSNGIIHRDIKPDNILFDRDGTPKLSDFGLARSLDGVTRTESHERLGARAYMAPEWEINPKLARSDVRGDLFSFGIVLYEACAGRLPFPTSSALTLAPPGRHVLRIPATKKEKYLRYLETIIERCLDYPAKHRYSSAAEITHDLSRWLRNQPVPVQKRDWYRRTRYAFRRHPHVAVAAPLLVVLLILIWNWVVTSSTNAGVRSAYELVVIDSCSSFLDSLHQWEESILNPRSLASPTQEQERARLQADLDYALALKKVIAEEHIRSLREWGTLRGRTREISIEFYESAAEWYAQRGLVRESEQEWAHAAELQTAQPEYPPDCELTLETIPSHARAELFLVNQGPDGVWEENEIEMDERDLVTPISLKGLHPGSYILKVVRPGNERRITYPVVLNRGKPWIGRDVYLPEDEEIGEGWAYVPEGPFVSGGDRRAFNGGPRTIRRLYGFFMMKTELRFGEYFDFLREFQSRGYIRTCPCSMESCLKMMYRLFSVAILSNLYNKSYSDLLSSLGSIKTSISDSQSLGYFSTKHFPRDGDGSVLFEPSALYAPPSNLPNLLLRSVHSICYTDVFCYLIWRNSKALAEGSVWQYYLPTEWQWEKAARGTDGRAFAWGNSFSWRNVFSPRNPDLVGARSHELNPMQSRQCSADRSPYGVWDVCSVAREFVLSEAAPELSVMLCGGEDVAHDPDQFRLSTRSFANISEINWHFGFRLIKVRR